MKPEHLKAAQTWVNKFDSLWVRFHPLPTLEQAVYRGMNIVTPDLEAAEKRIIGLETENEKLRDLINKYYEECKSELI